ncbi:hypothetical protein [Anaerobranca gottschalkii]|uniref:Uncharacterized protein n=1 Tax=Anaerobranca gottschalkii DSM 13577 TaxID=1120990 RepID=A0A1H9Z7X9_9FIRM|nr:hypothetical protein [Anaerobranca gottschalkii]SES77604.1 hypothetical protein SAMN03080614_100729 [Anaerobranca gottschalkii DSM 13577]
MKIRWGLIAVITLIGLLIFFLFNTIFAKLTVEKPLLNILEKHQGILAFEVEEENNSTSVQITLENYNNPITIHREIEKALSRVLKDNFRIKYNNPVPKEDSEGWEKYWRVNGIISETLNTQNYTGAMRALDELLGENNYYFLVENNQLLIKYEIDSNIFFDVYYIEGGNSDGN